MAKTNKEIADWFLLGKRYGSIEATQDFIALFDEVFEREINNTKDSSNMYLLTWDEEIGYMPKRTKWWYINIANK